MISVTSHDLDALQHRAAYAPLTDRAFLRITGEDATRWLNGMVTNNIKDLPPGEGNDNFLLNAQGRIQADCTIYREPTDAAPTYLLETGNWQLETVSQHLDKFIIMDDVELATVAGLSGILVAGPEALSVVGAIGSASHRASPCSEAPPAPVPQTPCLKQTSYGGATVSLILSNPTTPCFELWSDPATVAAILAELQDANVQPATPAALEAHRILSGTPRYGADITDKDLPQETALNGGTSHALHFSKGCYLGQEIVERIHSRGQVHRMFTRFTLEGAAPILPAPLTVTVGGQAKPAGELTSAVQVDGHLHALGYVRREHAAKPLTYEGGTATATIPR